MFKKRKLDITDEQAIKCNAIIHSHSALCGGVGTGMAQIPLADNAVITPIQIAMIIELGAVFKRKISKSVAQSILSGAAASLVGRGISQVLCGWIPIAGNAINTATAAGITEAIGWMAVDKFSKEKYYEDSVDEETITDEESSAVFFAKDLEELKESSSHTEKVENDDNVKVETGSEDNSVKDFKVPVIIEEKEKDTGEKTPIGDNKEKKHGGNTSEHKKGKDKSVKINEYEEIYSEADRFINGDRDYYKDNKENYDILIDKVEKIVRKLPRGHKMCEVFDKLCDVPLK